VKKYMVRCDMEGASGVVSPEQVIPGRREYEFGCRMLMADLMAVLQGLGEGGADEVVVYDKHFHGRNIDMTRIPDHVRVVCGRPPYVEEWAGELDSSFEGVILLGFPAKAGTERGILAHSYDGDIRDIRLNGTSVGEVGMEAAIAGDFGVPVMLVTGDTSCVNEASDLIPGVFGVVVKDSLGATSGVCYSLGVTTGLIRNAAEKVVKQPPSAGPCRLDGEARLEVELKDGRFCDGMKEAFGERMKEGTTIVLEAAGALEAWAEYQRQKQQVLRALGGEMAGAEPVGGG